MRLCIKYLCFTLVTTGLLFISVPQNVHAQSAAAAAEIRFQQLEKELRRLTGQIEEQNYEIRQLKQALNDVKSKMSVASEENNPANIQSSSGASDDGFQYTHSSEGLVQQQEQQQQQQVASASQSLGTLNTSPDTGAISAPEGAPRAYDYAYSFIKARDFDRAEVEFAKFMAQYPKSDLTSNAKYWYGETFYVRGNYQKSARIFAEGYQKFPKASKAASNLLKLGMSLVGMQKTEDACVAFKQLKKEYSASSIPVLKRTESEMKKINCV